MKRKEFMQFGKKTDNVYKIIERKFKDNSVYFFIEITNTFDLQCFDIKFPETYIFEKSFKRWEDALKCVEELKEEDKKITVLEEKIHIL
jgi:hypothetical protein